MKKTLRSTLYTGLAPFTKHAVYVQQTGLSRGLKRRGGIGFLPIRKPLTKEHQCLQSLDLRGLTVYDIGGHIGLVTLFFARAVGSQGRVITFEPNPRNAAAIRDHLELNHVANVRLMLIGLGQRAERLKFVVPRSSARGTAHPDRQGMFLSESDAEVFEIEVDTLDHQIALHQLPKPDFIKIDVEGLEMAVLDGMAQTLTTHRPQLWIELHNDDAPDIARTLLDYGYHVHQVEDNHEITQDNLGTAHEHVYATPHVAERSVGSLYP